MIWLVTIPLVVFFTFKNMIEGNWLMLHAHGNWDGPAPPFYQWPFLAVIFTIFVGLFISAFVSVFILAIPMIIGSQPKMVGVVDIDYPLMTLREREGMSGTFFLGSGHIEDRQYYFWYRKNADGSISGGKTLREPCVKIRDTKDGEAPFMRTYRTQYANPTLASWWYLVTLDVRGDTGWCESFFIPPGSIKEGYSL